MPQSQLSSQVQLEIGQIGQWLQISRQNTLNIFKDLDRQTFCYQAHGEFSPVGWHLGHIGYTEALWILNRCAGLPAIAPHYNRIFAADGLPKSDRVHLPDCREIYNYLDTIRQQVLDYLFQLDAATLQTQSRLWRWLIQHESQHCETVALVLQLQGYTFNQPQATKQGYLAKLLQDEMVEVPAGYFEQGDNSLNAIDNESPAHAVYLPTYYIDRYPVTCAQYQKFIEADGYSDRRWWSEAGWQWLRSQQDTKPVSAPLYWYDPHLLPNHPVCGVSWYEADAYARFVGKRLPTEAEWEKAASWNPHQQKRQSCTWENNTLGNHSHKYGRTTAVNEYAPQTYYGCSDMLGNVWEWTASLFQPYPNFVGFPYAGYSSTYFDSKHFVLKGGSWATFDFALRPSFRNWYYPYIRQIFAGFRCATS